MNTRQQHMDYRAWRSALLLLFTAVFSLPLYGQYNTETFQLKKQSEQYDERGFMKGQVINVDGKMAVSNANGGVSYSYTLDKFTQKGYGFHVSLNYANSVNMASFKVYNTGTPREGGGENPDAWDAFTRTHPMWIIGVNGFAVQTLSLASDYMPPSTGTTTMNQGEMPWLVEGYDYCNRMNRLENMNQYDVIKLLREDGGVLELRNPYLFNSSGVTAGMLAEGYYFEDATNPTGFAKVDYDTVRILPQVLEGVRNAIATGYDWRMMNYQLLPRRVRYYPGDGLEYVFTEHQLPYGSERYQLGAHAAPTIFYLVEINDATGVVLDLEYSRHASATDDTPGRALLKRVGEYIYVGYSDQFVTVQAHGRTTSLQLEKGIPFEKFDKDGGEVGSKESSIGLVKTLRDPEGRVTEFGYEGYDRTYVNYKHPLNGVYYLNIHSQRLRSITEPRARYAIQYHGGTVGSPQIVFNQAPPNPNDKPLANWLLNNAASTVDKFDRNNKHVSTETYCFDGLTTSQQMGCNEQGFGTMPTTTYTLTDRQLNKQKQVVYQFQKLEVDRYLNPSGTHPLAIPLVYTALLGASEQADGTEQNVQTGYYHYPNTALFVPVSSQVFRAVGTANYRTSYTTTSYDINWHPDHTGYHGPVLATQMYMSKILKKTETVHNPLAANQNEIMVKNVEEYQHFPRLTTPQQVAQVRWDKYASLHKHDSLVKAGVLSSAAGSWENMPDSLQVFDTLAVRQFWTPPVFGLVKARYQLDALGNYLGGSATLYDGSSIALGQNRRGLPIADSIIARNRSSVVLGAKYGYGSQGGSNGGYGWTHSDERFPVWQQNAYGARQEQAYRFATRQIPSGLRLNENGTSKQEELRDRLMSIGVEKPLIQRKLVRNAATGATDTLQTRSEWTYYGLLSGQADANGYYSQFLYDKNGRLQRAHLPKDFLGQAATCMQMLDGTLDYATPNNLTRVRQKVRMIRCSTSGNGQILSEWWEDNDGYMPLHAGKRYFPAPCPYVAPQGIASGGGGSTPQEHTGKRGQEKVLAPIGNYDERHVVVANDMIQCNFATTGADNVFAAATTLRSGKFRVFVSSMQGTCLLVEALVRRHDTGDTLARRLLTLNCPVIEAGPKPTGLANAEGGKRETTLSSQSEQDFALDIVMTASELQSIRQIGADGGAVEFRVLTPDAHLTLVAEGEDKAPRWVLDGVFNLPVEQQQYTVAYEYSKKQDNLVTQYVKTDDLYTMVNAPAGSCRAMRPSQVQHTLGGDGQVEKTLLKIGDPNIPVRIDSVKATYTGLGQVRVSTDQQGYQTTTDYDAWGRPTKVTNPDGSYSTITYSFGDPLQLVGDNDQNFYGYCEKVETTVFDASNTQENRSAVFSDAFGRKRREAVGANLAVQTKYEYDNLNRLTTVVNPEGDTTRYWYDDFGRVHYKYQPDMGYTSYAYDKLGQVRLAQTQQQHAEGTLTFTEYDDLGRVTLVGEAKLVQGGGGGGHGVAGFGGKKEQGMSFPPHPAVNLNRLTDQISGAVLNDGGISTTPTANKTVWLQPSTPVPSFWGMSDLAQSYCAPPTMVGTPVFPYLTHGVQPNDDPGLPTATPTTFENISLYPQNGRIAIVYDALPTAGGSVWTHFPAQAQWNALAPTGTVRNLKGHEVAVAYRTHAGEPYHFVVMSYDERGRVEALLRYTENIGFDAVYYTYNALNAVTSVRAVDAMRQHTTWYGYDWNGRVDSVWAYLTPAGQGLGISNPAYPAPAVRPSTADIVYTYTKRGQVASMAYPPANAAVQYAYNSRRFLDTMLATKNGAQLFSQILRYDAQGLITRQEAQHSGQTPSASDYVYQNGTNFLTAFVSSGNGGWNQENYSYDNVGNRVGLTMPMGGVPQTQEYQYADANGPNRLSKLVRRDLQGSVIDETNYSYNASGAMNSRVVSANGSSTSESYAYDNVQGLVKKYTLQTGGVTGEWRYRYSAAGEREQKRQYQTQGVLAPKEWVYYLLDGSKRQLAVYKGAEVAENTCGYFASSWSPRVFIAPEEYLSYGIGDVHNITIRPNDPNTSRKEYKIQDHLGNTRVVLDGSGVVIGQYDYKPFGGILWQSAPTPRLSFIDKEKDKETGLSNFGVRNYDDGLGRFMSVDVLWESYRSLTPYNYCSNNPLRLKDPSGFGEEEGKIAETNKELNPKTPGVTITDKRGNTTEFKIELIIGLRMEFGPVEINLSTMNAENEVSQGFTAGVVQYERTLTPVKLEQRYKDGHMEIVRTQTEEVFKGVGSGIIFVGRQKNTTISENIVTHKRDTTVQLYNVMTGGFSAIFGAGVDTNFKTLSPVQPVDMTPVFPHTATIHVPDSQVKVELSK